MLTVLHHPPSRLQAAINHAHSRLLDACTQAAYISNKVRVGTYKVWRSWEIYHTYNKYVITGAHKNMCTVLQWRPLEEWRVSGGTNGRWRCERAAIACGFPAVSLTVLWSGSRCVLSPCHTLPDWRNRWKPKKICWNPLMFIVYMVNIWLFVPCPFHVLWCSANLLESFERAQNQ